jgi:outer membrane protein TolC
MNKKVWFVVLLLSQGLNAESLTLHRAISQTLAHHPDVKRFMLNIESAKQGYNSAYADYLPQLNATATYTATQTYVLPNNGGFSTIDDDGWNASISLRQKVWDFSKTAALVEASHKDEEIANLSLQEVKALLAYKVKSLYQLLLVQRKAVEVRQKDLASKELFYHQAQALVKQGLKTHADTQRFLSSVYAAKDALALAKSGFEKAKVSLSLYMGKPISSTVKLQSHILTKKSTLTPAQVKQILAKNYKMKMDAKSVEKGKLLHQANRNAHFGSIDVVATHSRFDTLNSYNTDYVGVSYSIPLYSGGRLSAQEQQAKIGYQMAQEQSASDKMALKEELEGLRIDLRHYATTILAKKAQIRSAKSALKIVKARYKEGLATYVEVLDATSVWLNAELGLLESYYSRSLAGDRIDYLKGKI